MKRTIIILAILSSGLVAGCGSDIRIKDVDACASGKAVECAAGVDYEKAFPADPEAAAELLKLYRKSTGMDLVYTIK